MKKKIILWIFILSIAAGIIYCTHLCFKKMNTPDVESDITGKDINKEEYMYKEELLTLNYNIEEIKIIEQKIKNIDVENYLLNEKYNNLTKFIESPYFNIKNIKRYQEYYDKNNTYTPDIIVMHVEIGIDNPFYTNIIKTDTTKNELMLVNKYNALDQNYNPNLVNVESSYGKGKAEKTTYDYFVKMCDAAKKDNIILKSVSFYRSYNSQLNIYNGYVKRDGEEKADTYSARAGHSEHQTGMAVDINTCSSKSNFENTKEYDWLINNSYKYGFILRYPLNKTYITGYKYEPWHFRYVGIDAANKIFEEQITFEEYLVKYGQQSY